MRVEADTAYVLHKRPYRETSLLLDVFTYNHGRVGLIAKGARRPKSGQSVLLQPLRRLSMSWSARSELGTLTAVEATGMPSGPTTAALLAGFYVNELIVRLLHRHDPHPELFSAYEAVLNKLDDEQQQQQALRYFEVDLLDAIGFGLVLDHDVIAGKPLAPDTLYQYVTERGPSAEEVLPGQHVSVHGQTLLDLAARSISSATGLREAKQLLRQETGSHLGDRPLASRSLYQSYLKNRSY